MSAASKRTFGFSQLCGFIGAAQVLVLGLLISLLTYSHLHTQLQSEQRSDAYQQIERLSQTLSASLIQQDRISLNLAVKEWQRGEDIRALRVLTPEGKPLAETGPLVNDAHIISRAITLDDATLGVVQAEISPAPVSRQSGRYLSLALIATGLFAMLAGLISYFLAERMAGYIRKLTAALQRWQDDKPLDLPEQTLPIAELQQLNQQCAGIQQQQRQRQAVEKALGKYLYSGSKPPVTAATYHRCALVYIEISDLDVLQSRLSAEELGNVLSEYYRLMNQAVKLYNGKLDRYQGDGLVMIFGLNESSERDTIHCIYAAQLCLGLLQNAQSRNPLMASVSFRIAAHWGPVLLAPMQQHDEDNATDSVHYSLIGDTLYWASHLARRSEDNRLLASQVLISELPPEYGVEWDEGPLVKNLQGSQQSNFWLKDLPETSRTLIERQIRHITSMTENA
ncbi:adenylate/guanylate cyclase domain-containing protein [Oceanobacter kriegii]|uniref:adenylate/guanylate cyclase domain-containing protein n=1 Tax=Oceanobacter kriegii TaxID=64972 RepID=UPI000420DC04|nr:adenylate/guanylate cyclase domain-containing protein [Oceanobacter kriegii]